MASPLISIIVPIYNVEKYLPCCLDSILAQTYQNLEIILVDDGSPDGCGAICDAYASRDSRIKVVHQANGGVAAARNAGLDRATGDYIGFVDPDDWIEPTMYEVMMHHITKENCDGAACSSLEESFAGTKVRERFDYHVLHQPELTRVIVEEEIRASLVRTLVTHEAWDQVRFSPETRSGEDFEVFPHLFLRCESLVFLPDLLYHWRMQAHSITHLKPTIEIRMHHVRLFRKRLDFCREHFPQSIPYVSRRAVSRTLALLRYFAKNGQEDLPEAEDLITFLKDNRVQFAPHLDMVERFHLFSYFSARSLFLLYNKFFFWNRARIAKRRSKKMQS